MAGWRRLFPGLIAALLVLVASAVAAQAEKRVALVIGNSAYRNVPQLANPKHDAADMADKLDALGFEVVRGIDVDLQAMRRTVRDFIARLDKADLALFYYAGHGLQVNGENYLAPTDARLASYDDLDFEALPITLILSAMERNTKTNLVFLDACRDNPLAENLARSMGTRSGSVGRGLARIGSGVGSLISLATQPGNVALDGRGRNSPFTTALLKHLGTPGQDITRDLILVRRDVLDATGGRQVPWDHSSLTGEVVLKELPRAETPPQAPAPPKPDNAPDLAYWEAIKGSTDKSYFEAYLQQFPQGIFAGLARLKVAALDRKAADDEARKAREAAAAVEAERLAKAQAEARAAEARAEEERLAREKAEEAAAQARAEADRLAGQAAAKAEAERVARGQAEGEATARQAEEVARQAAETANAETADRETQEQIEVASLPQREEPPAAVDTAELTRSVQTELNRLGCSVGRVDGKWGSGSARALKDFAGRQGIRLASAEPTTDILDRLKATTARVCPLVCGRGMEEKNGRCEKIERAASVEPKADPRPEAPAAAVETRPATRSGQTCAVCNLNTGPVRLCAPKGMDPLQYNYPGGKATCTADGASPKSVPARTRTAPPEKKARTTAKTDGRVCYSCENPAQAHRSIECFKPGESPQTRIQMFWSCKKI